MAKKHLHELLTEEQEPFVLKDYISEKRCQIKRPVPETQLQLKRRVSISESPTFSGNFCKNLKKSPLFNFPSPAKSPIRNPNTCFIKPPSKTTALLLEAALRIQKQKQSKNTKSIGFGFFGSILKKISSRKRNRKREICARETKVESVKDILRWESFDGCEEKYENPEEMAVDLNEKEISEMGFSCSCNASSCSGSNEDKSMDLETSSSSSAEDFEEFAAGRLEEDFCSCEKEFCSSPFRFISPVKSSYSGSQTPEFESPASSPDCRTPESIEEGELDSCLSRSRGDESSGSPGKEEENEAEKEQLSPVSVLDPPFEDDDEHNFQHSSTMQRAKHLLNKLRRFERLAKLDPLELDKLYDEEQEESDEDDPEKEENGREIELLFLQDEEVEELVWDALHQTTSCCYLERIPRDMWRLVLHLIEEEKEEAVDDKEVVDKVCKRIKSWKEAESNTVDVTVDIDFRREDDAWKKCRKEVEEIGIDIELAIFALLVEEVSADLV